MAPRTRSISIVKLWERLTKMPQKQRQEAMLKLDSTSKAELSKYLQDRKSHRCIGSSATVSADVANGTSETSSSSSSDDSESSDSEQVVPPFGAKRASVPIAMPSVKKRFSGATRATS